MRSNHSQQTKLHTQLIRASVLIAAAATAACGGDDGTGGEGGAGAGVGNGPSSGSGNLTMCTEIVDSVTVIDGATTPDIVRAGDGYLVAAISGGQAWVVSIDASAGILGSAQLSDATTDARLPTMHRAGSGFVALWAEGSTVLSRAVGSNGMPSGSIAHLATVQSAEPRPAGATTGDDVAAAWMEGATSIAGMLAGNTLEQSVSVPGWFPALANTNGGVATAWSNGGMEGPVNVALLSSMGSPVAVSGSASLIKSMASLGDDVAVAWEDVSSGVEPRVRVARVAPSSGVVTEVLSSPGDSSANWPSVSWSDAGLALAYYQFRDGPPSIYLTFYDGNLEELGNEVTIADDARYPATAWGADGSVGVAYASEAGPVAVSIVACP